MGNPGSICSFGELACMEACREDEGFLKLEGETAALDVNH
jgi:hypothetical protein